MHLIDRFLALAKTPPFDRISLSELMPIAEVARRRRFAPGAQLGAAGRPLPKLYVLLEGNFADGKQQPAPGILGLAGVLQDRALTQPWTAGPDGATALTIERGHLFTILYACPQLALGLVDLQEPQALEISP